MSTLNLGINAGLSNAEYHAEREHLSSSNLKLLLQSPAEFYRTKVLGQGVKTSSPAMDLGSYVHSLILEPDLVDKEFALWTGWRKQGLEYEKWAAEQGKRIIISQPQAHNGQKLARTIQACPPALDVLSGGVPELSLAAQILGVPVKMRADYLNASRSYIADIKTTRHPIDSKLFRQTVKQLGYDLSASLYCEVAFQIYSKLFDFYWVLISKADNECVVYKASSNTLSDGARLVNQALVTYKRCSEANVWPESLLDMPKSPQGSFEIEEI